MSFDILNSFLLTIWKWVDIYGVGNIICYCLGRTLVLTIRWSRGSKGLTNKVLQIGFCKQCKKIVIKKYGLLSLTRRTQIWESDDRIKIPNCSYHRLTIKRVVKYWLMK